MKIVIDIPEEIKQKRDAGKVLSNEEITTVCMAIKNGAPLPTDAVDRVTIKEYLESFSKDTNEQEPCEDCISRQAVLDLPRIKTHNVWGNVIYESVDVDAVRQLPSVSPQPCEDAISRQVVLEAIDDDNRNGHYSCFATNNDAECFKQIIRELPSVTAQPKIGYWEWLQYDGNPKIGNWHCSECGCIVVEAVDKNKKGGIPLYKYCPQCGCKLQEVEE